MITILPASSTTDREWNFRHGTAQHLFGDIPKSKPEISLTLNWQADAESQLVGRYKFDLPFLLSEGLVRRTVKGVRLRFQRTDDFIEIAISRRSHSVIIGRLAIRPKHLTLKTRTPNLHTLDGFLTICSFCKSIRDHNKIWQNLENYISSRSNAKFTHGICQDCTKTHFPDFC